MSLMRKHQQQVYQQQRNQSVQMMYRESRADQYRQALAAMHQDQNTLKSLTDHAERNRLGVEEMLPKHIGYVRHWLAAGQTHQNDVLVQCIVWAADGGAWAELQELATHAIRLKMPLHWMRRSLAEFVADAIFRATEAEFKTQRNNVLLSSETDMHVVINHGLYQAFVWALKEIESHQNGWAEVNNVIHARYHKMAGQLQLAMTNGQPGAALQHFIRADALYPNIGVKSKIKELQPEVGADNNDSLAAQPPQPSVAVPSTPMGKTG